MIPGNTSGRSEQYVDNGEWELLKVTQERNVIPYLYAVFDDVTFTIAIGRNYFTYCVNLIIPCFLISAMIFLGFILPPECGERIGLSITVLLAMTVFQQLTANIFPSFDFPLLGQYYFATTVEISLSLIATTIVLNFTTRTNKKVPRWLRILLLKWTARVVFLKKTVERSRPKPSRHRSRSSRSRATKKYIVDKSTTGNNQRRGNVLEKELKDVSIISKNLDYGGPRYANATSSELNGNCSADFIVGGPVCQETRDDADAPSTGVHDENGEELDDDEMALRHWEWVMAARVLDRTLLWVSIVVGIATFFIVFLRAPRLQQLIFGS